MKKNGIIKVINEQTPRLCVVVSPNEMNIALNTLIVCPLITTKRCIPTQIAIKPNTKSGLRNGCFLALDQITIIDKATVVDNVGEISEREAEQVALVLQEMFAP